MRIDPVEPAREFAVGELRLRHVADVELEPDEIVTFRTASGTEYDVGRKEWGYYATPSLNRRAREHGLRGALAVNADGRATLLLVEAGREPAFEAYCEREGMRVVAWLDSDAAVDEAVRRLDAP
jgi:hypothetical protein